MITMTYECPETHQLLPNVSTVVWAAPDGDTVPVVIHCPHCSKRHAFSRADAILAFDTPIRMSDRRLIGVE